jgi:hypothetical protein
MFKVAASSVEWIVRLLLYVSGVASTIVGSLISSKIRVYHDNRKAHLDDIKQKVLIPLNNALAGTYRPLVKHQSPVVIEEWGVRIRKKDVSVTEYPNEQGPLLVSVAPDIRSAMDQALYLDAKKKHFSKLIIQTEKFLAAWHSHAEECHGWVAGLAEEILANCQLPTHPVTHGSSYVMHFRLGVFVYRRLFHNVELALHKRNQNPGWVVEGFDGTPAAGTEQEMDTVISGLDRLIEREKGAADRLLRNARVLEQDLSSLCDELNYAIAARRLRGKCALVPFF